MIEIRGCFCQSWRAALATEGSEAGQAFDNICRRITGEAVPLMDLNRSNGILGKLTGFFHRNSQ